MSSRPYAPIHWPLVPGRTALVVIDMQNDFLHADGWFATHGVAIGHSQAAIAPTQRLVAAARARGVPIVWLRHGFRDARDGGVSVRLRPFLAEGGLRSGTWGTQLLDAMDVQPQDWIVDKNRPSGFYATNLELVLRGLDAQTLLFAGVATHQCVAATTRDASFRDFQVVTVRECTGTSLPEFHQPTLDMMQAGWGEVRALAQTLDDLAALGGG